MNSALPVRWLCLSEATLIEMLSIEEIGSTEFMPSFAVLPSAIIFRVRAGAILGLPDKVGQFAGMFPGNEMILIA